MERAEFVAELQSRIMDDFNASRFGTRETVLCEGYDAERGVFVLKYERYDAERDVREWESEELPLAMESFEWLVYDPEDR